MIKANDCNIFSFPVSSLKHRLTKLIWIPRNSVPSKLQYSGIHKINIWSMKWNMTKSFILMFSSFRNVILVNGLSHFSHTFSYSQCIDSLGLISSLGEAEEKWEISSNQCCSSGFHMRKLLGALKYSWLRCIPLFRVSFGNTSFSHYISIKYIWSILFLEYLWCGLWVEYSIKIFLFYMRQNVSIS